MSRLHYSEHYYSRKAHGKAVVETKFQERVVKEVRQRQDSHDHQKCDDRARKSFGKPVNRFFACSSALEKMLHTKNESIPHKK